MAVIDLTLTYSSLIKGFSSESATKMDVDGWNATNLHIYSHAGTHMDAPFHFEVSNQRIDEIAVDRFLTKAWVVNIPISQPKELITDKDLFLLNDKIAVGDSIIIKTGWHKFIAEDSYRNDLPRIAESAANWLVNKQINILAVEPPSVADVNNLPEVTKIHQILLGGNIIIVEGLCNTDALTKDYVQLIALPLKVLAGDGAPSRVIAIQE